MGAAKNKNKKKKPKITGNTIFNIAVGVIIIILSIAIVHQYIILSANKAKEKELNSEISKVEAIGNSLKNQQNNQDSPEFIEKMAREKLNMVKPNEIVFIDKNNPEAKIPSVESTETTTAQEK